MCFSPAASFAAAAVTTVTGCMALRRCTGWREIPLAALPLVFASQQAMEGAIWLGLLHPSHAGFQPLFTALFLTLALVVWPVLAPAAAILVEPIAKRRRLQLLLWAAGSGVSAYSLANILRHPYVPSIVGNSICYINQTMFPPAIVAAYILVVCAPLLISSHPALRAFGLTVVAGLAVSFTAYYFTFVSVWCFFAAAASVIIYAHFRTPTFSARWVA